MTLIIITLIILLSALSWRYIIRLEPAGVFAGMWIMMTATVLLLSDFIDLRYHGMIYVLICVTLFISGTIFCDYSYHPIPSVTKLTFQKDRALPLIAVLFAGAMVNPLYSIVLHGFSLQALLSMQDLLNMNKVISEDRYMTGGITNALNQFFLIFSYAAPCFGGFCYRWVGKWTKALCILTLFPGMVIALTQSIKLGMITGFILWFTGYLVCSFSYGLSIRIKAKAVLYSLVGLAGFFGILFISMVFRTGEVSEKTVLDISQKFITYALGHFHCFDVWYDTYEPMSYSFGTKTFMGVSNILGLEERIQGVYQEYMQVGKNGYYGISNIYTCFRALIEDFGEAGAALLMFLLGFLTKLSLKNLLCHRYIQLNQLCITAAYAYLFLSFATSFFTYTSYMATFFIAYFLFHFLQKETIPC